MTSLEPIVGDAAHPGGPTDLGIDRHEFGRLLDVPHLDHAERAASSLREPFTESNLAPVVRRGHASSRRPVPARATQTIGRGRKLTAR